MAPIVKRLVAIFVCATALGCGAVTDPSTPPTRPPQQPSFAIPPGPYTPGQSYFGRNNYIEYVAGNAPVIYSAPHGGALTPSEIPDRTAGNCGGSATTTTDLNTIELVRAMGARHFARFGTRPHLIISHLARRKLDANRTAEEARRVRGHGEHSHDLGVRRALLFGVAAWTRESRDVVREQRVPIGAQLSGAGAEW
jgi:hypothetical protein